ncbi:2-oxo-4-hydroxy-4-carboxy-5-ureidoimidazoline decarboxylase [Actinoplanes sp. CA-030573]|uniref:2-oxo-4-hydroxy-4-carboxy-5-ureidoimidazoline decarboxylase n=1 Tax=Actinoplanes sp. CA-030573 TaxID=3239898 RepID=UPI003D9491C6
MDAVEVFNSLPAARLEEDLRACCAAPGWGAAVAAKRPYRERHEIISAGDAAARALSWDEVRLALSAHPRIGERPTGASREAAWSRREQSAAAATAGEPAKAALVAANQAYEKRFGHVFLIFASGRTQEEILAEARKRLANDEGTERVIVAEELRKIVLLRLERVLDAL